MSPSASASVTPGGRRTGRQGSDSTNTAINPRIHWGFCQDAPGTPTNPPTRDRRPRPGAVVTGGNGSLKRDPRC